MPSPHPTRQRSRCPTRTASWGLLAAGAAVLVPAAAAAAQEGSPAPASLSQGAYAFENVTVIPMDRERTLPDHTVVVENGRIIEVGSAGSVQVPDGAERIDGSGRYLIPGLAEMHAHVPSSDDPPRDQVEEILFLFVANGITTMRGMLGAPYQLELREEIARGEVLGPAFYVGAPSLRGANAPDAETAEARVRANAAAGYDLQKIHPGVPRDAWDRMVEVARELDFSFAGHVPEDVGIHHAIETGMSTVDHLDGYLEATRRDDLPEDAPQAEMFRATDREKLEALARKTAEHDVFLVPTQYLWNHLRGIADVDRLLAEPEFRYVSAAQRESWAQSARNRTAQQGITPEASRAHAQWRQELLGALHAAGAPILMGTDSPQLFNVPGFALHRELPLMVDAGMTPYEVLASGTRNVARYVEEDLGRPGDFGTVEAGNRADLVLLEANPLESVEALQARAGVMVRGRWLPEAEIRDRLDAIARAYAEDGGGR